MTKHVADQHQIIERWRTVADGLSGAVERLLDAPTSGAGSFAERQGIEAGAIEALRIYQEALDA